MTKMTSFLILALSAVIPAAAATPLPPETAAEEMLSIYLEVQETRWQASPNAAAFCSGSAGLSKGEINAEFMEWIFQGAFSKEQAGKLAKTMHRVYTSLDTYTSNESTLLTPLLKRIASIRLDPTVGGYDRNCTLYPSATFMEINITSSAVAATFRTRAEMMSRLDTAAQLAAAALIKIELAEAKTSQAAAVARAAELLGDSPARETIASMLATRAPELPDNLFRGNVGAVVINREGLVLALSSSSLLQSCQSGLPTSYRRRGGRRSMAGAGTKMVSFSLLG